MAVTGNYAGNVYVPICQTLANTTKIAVGTAMDDDTLTLASFAFCNDNASAVVCQLYWYDAANTTEHLIWQKPVATDATEVVESLPLRLREGDEIRVVGNSSVHVTLIFMLNFALTR
ncbi:hypothetical protein FA04_14550 [Ensifer adhaerens]|uniref:Uncharacterized protein n=1 Tax=Ensifer adhaerens TaxID=106592 RepID=A0ABY8HDI4_ENSAD|nr:hypothetical protein [Ensifer adhaerens]ANK73732.1 hypothetical protein FA04_14550 [Ensifer adhaerens]KDP70306.1 hypothetical protein FA04_29160 [Ensifer adhaerens]WFP89816.1 hypothetical protein P4B07_14780 [Ensifer adhaerens]